MKDYVEEYWEYNKLIEVRFDQLGRRLGAIAYQKNISTNKYNYRTPANVVAQQNAYEKSAVGGDECKNMPTGKEHNNLYWREFGSISAIIGKNRNQIDDIGDFNISDAALRCYDTSKDFFHIAWLFSPEAHFHATKIWGGKNEPVHFEGEWRGGDFGDPKTRNAIWESPKENWKTDMKFFHGKILQTPGSTPVQSMNTNMPKPLVYYVWENGAHSAPKSVRDIAQMINDNKMVNSTEIWRDGLGPNYVMFYTIPEHVQIQQLAMEMLSNGGKGHASPKV